MFILFSAYYVKAILKLSKYKKIWTWHVILAGVSIFSNTVPFSKSAEKCENCPISVSANTLFFNFIFTEGCFGVNSYVTLFLALQEIWKITSSEYAIFFCLKRPYSNGQFFYPDPFLCLIVCEPCKSLQKGS